MQFGLRVLAAVGLGAVLVTGLGIDGHTTATIARAQVEPTATINFDDAPANRSGSPAAPAITDRYRDLGVLFATPVTPLVYDGDSIPALPDLPRSGSTVITTCYSQEFCSNQVELAFADGHEAVEVWAGYGTELPNPAELVAEGFGPDGLVDRDSATLGPSDIATPVSVPLRLADPAGTIVRVVVRWADESLLLGGLVLDDIGLTRFVARLGLRADPAFLFLDGADGPVTEVVAVTNVGNVPAPIADARFEPATSPGPAVSVVATTCPGELPVAETCDVEVAYEPVDGETATGVVVVAGGDGTSLLDIDVEATGAPAPAGGDTGATDDATTSPTDPAESTPTPGEDAGATDEAGATEPGTRGDPTPVVWILVLVVLAAVGIAAVVVARGRRPPRTTAPLPEPVEPPRPRPAPDVHVRARGDAGTQVMQPTDTPVISIRARMRDDTGPVLVDPTAPREGAPR